MSVTSLEIFQDLYLRTQSSVDSIRDQLLVHVKAPWRHDVEREQNVKNFTLKSEDVIALIREPFNDIDEAGLILWQTDDGYRVSNIVPRTINELSITKYNAILQDFVARLAQPAATVGGFVVDLTPSQQTLDDWLDAAPAALLRRFSTIAIKSMGTGTGHPKDRSLWFEFLIAAYQTSARLDSDCLARWLSEVDGWPSDAAHKLAIDYEFALGLLEQYDDSLR
jgi:hypothetical protein